jgi:hypothetical protein
VQDLAPGGMTVQVLEDDRLLLFADLDAEDAGLEGLVLELLDDLVLVKCEVAWRAAATVQDCGYFSFASQAAARTFPCVFPEFRNQIKIVSHD